VSPFTSTKATCQPGGVPRAGRCLGRGAGGWLRSSPLHAEQQHVQGRQVAESEKVATDSPPMMATASGPQNTLRVSGIMARIAVAAVNTTGRAGAPPTRSPPSQSDIPFAVSCSIWSIRIDRVPHVHAGERDHPSRALNRTARRTAQRGHRPRSDPAAR